MKLDTQWRLNLDDDCEFLGFSFSRRRVSSAIHHSAKKRNHLTVNTWIEMEQFAEHKMCTNEFFRVEMLKCFGIKRFKIAIFEMDYDGISRRRWLLNDFVWAGALFSVVVVGTFETMKRFVKCGLFRLFPLGCIS